MLFLGQRAIPWKVCSRENGKEFTEMWSLPERFESRNRSHKENSQIELEGSTCQAIVILCIPSLILQGSQGLVRQPSEDNPRPLEGRVLVSDTNESEGWIPWVRNEGWIEIPEWGMRGAPTQNGKARRCLTCWSALRVPKQPWQDMSEPEFPFRGQEGKDLILRFIDAGE